MADAAEISKPHLRAGPRPSWSSIVAELESGTVHRWSAPIEMYERGEPALKAHCETRSWPPPGCASRRS